MLTAEIIAQGGQAISAAIEQTGSEGIWEWLDCVRSKFGKIDILVNNPGEVANCSLAELSVGDFKKNVEFHVDYLIRISARGCSLHACAPLRKNHKHLQLVIFGSGNTGQPGSRTCRHFRPHRSIALETAPDGITVNSLVKGDIAMAHLSTTDAEKLANRIPVKRLGTTADIVHAINFFASAWNRTYVTGQTLCVCGGKSAYFSMSV